jgi:hypothetical protein
LCRRIAHKLSDSGRWNSGDLEIFDSTSAADTDL